MGVAVRGLDFRQFQAQNRPQPDKPDVLRGVRQPKKSRTGRQAVGSCIGQLQFEALWGWKGLP